MLDYSCNNCLWNLSNRRFLSKKEGGKMRPNLQPINPSHRKRRASSSQHKRRISPSHKASWWNNQIPGNANEIVRPEYLIKISRSPPPVMPGGGKMPLLYYSPPQSSHPYIYRRFWRRGAPPLPYGYLKYFNLLECSGDFGPGILVRDPGT